MKMNKQQYGEYVKSMSPKSPIWKNMFNAFWVGGLICTVGQAILTGFKAIGWEETDAAAGTCIAMIFLGALLTGLSVYDNIAKIGGAGTLVPITGFSNAVVSPAMEFKSEGMITGLAVKLFSIAGPVIAYGVCASVIYGLVYWVTTLF